MNWYDSGWYAIERWLGSVLGIMLVACGSIAAQALPPCAERPTIFELPRTSSAFWCPEVVIESEQPLAFTALTITPDDTIYATRPLAGEVLRLRDANGDGLPETAETLLDGLRLPNGLHWHEDALYIVGDGVLYRWRDNADNAEILRDDLPAGRGAMTRALTVYDERVYIGVPLPCEGCPPEDDLHGTLLSMALDGDDLRVEAQGLQYPTALTVYEGDLWITDVQRGDVSSDTSHDEINRLRLDADNAETVPHYGAPYCAGSDHAAVSANDDFNCAETIAPVYALATGSLPMSLAVYESDVLPHLAGELLVALAGDADTSVIQGYALVSIERWHTDQTIVETLLPYDEVLTRNDRVIYDAATGYRSDASNFLNRRGAGPYPLHPYAVAVSPQGWIYLSVGSTLYALRPTERDACAVTVCRD